MQHPRFKQPKKVALLIETSLASGRDILSGIAGYVRREGPWSLFHVPRGLHEAAPKWLEKWKGDGIIARVSNPQIAKVLQGIPLPIVDVLGMMPQAPFPLVLADDAAISRQVFKYFVERGFKRFAFFGVTNARGAPNPWDWADRRRMAFCEDVRGFGAEASVLEMARETISKTSWEYRLERIAGWLIHLPKPVGLMVCSDQQGLEVLEACQRAGIHVPEQVAVVGVDDDKTICEVCSPPLSSVEANHTGVGYQAAALLDRLMKGETSASQEPISIPPARIVTRQSSDIMAVDDPKLLAALRLIYGHACEGISVDDIASQIGISRSVLQRRFRAALGETIHDHLIATRLKRAIELISGTDLPLGDVAERCGFNHQEYMGAVFVKRLGRTPAKYRTIS